MAHHRPGYEMLIAREVARIYPGGSEIFGIAVALRFLATLHRVNIRQEEKVMNSVHMVKRMGGVYYSTGLVYTKCHFSGVFLVTTNRWARVTCKDCLKLKG